MLVDQFQDEMNAITDEVMREFGSLTPLQINYKPNAKVWSIAQNIEHLIKVNDSYLPVLKKISTNTHQTPFMGKIKWWAKICGKFILKSVDPERSKKIKTFPIWQPAISDSAESLLDDFLENQQSLINQVKANADAINQGIVIGSPANANIVYPMSQALDIIINHAKRHIAQAKEMIPVIEENVK